ncbi:MAG: hypothetical protein ACHQ06_01620 [Candidatus Dormibacteria bacterium]
MNESGEQAQRSMSIAVLGAGAVGTRAEAPPRPLPPRPAEQ